MTSTWQKLGAFTGILGPTLFIVFIILAILIYPGEYNFLFHHLSNLGLTELGGIPTPLNYLLLSLAYTSAGTCMIPFWVALRSLFTESKRLSHTSLIGSLAGSIAAVFLSASALLAGNLLFELHRWVAILFFFFLSSAILVYSYGILTSKSYGNLYALLGVIVVALLYLHAFVPGLESPAIQKVVMFGLILWPLAPAVKLLKAHP